jgi:hypothetical protein
MNCQAKFLVRVFFGFSLCDDREVENGRRVFSWRCATARELNCQASPFFSDALGSAVRRAIWLSFSLKNTTSNLLEMAGCSL